MDSIPTEAVDSWQKKLTPFSAGFHIDGAKQQLMAAINARNATDAKIGNEWVLIPVITYIIGIVVTLVLSVMTLFDFFERIVADPYSPS